MMDFSDRSQWLKKVYNAQNTKELEKYYDAWSEDYEQDVNSFGYKNPAVIAGLIGRYVNPHSDPILDAGAGTGILGEILFSLGYKNLIGIDLSQAMLEIARKKSVYQSLHKMILGKHLNFHDKTFISVVSTGVFTANHAPPDAFDELIRITKKEGHIIFSLRSDGDFGKYYKEKQDELEKERKWKLIEVTKAYQSLPRINPDILNQAFVYKVL